MLLPKPVRMLAKRYPSHRVCDDAPQFRFNTNQPNDTHVKKVQAGIFLPTVSKAMPAQIVVIIVTT